jgi:hypothetical protein
MSAKNPPKPKRKNARKGKDLTYGIPSVPNNHFGGNSIRNPKPYYWQKIGAASEVIQLISEGDDLAAVRHTK